MNPVVPPRVLGYKEVKVVSHCANPECGAPFLYLRDGKVFAVPRHDAKAPIEFFWLCDSCSLDLELEFSRHDHLPMIVQRVDDGGAQGRREKSA